MSRGFNYWSGANVTVWVNDFPALEVVGLSVDGGETNKRPLYGYASRHFDAVARGQVLFHGELIINYVHQDYLYRVIELGLERQGLITAAPPLPSVQSPQDVAAATEAIRASSIEESTQLIQGMEQKFWDNTLAEGQELIPDVWTTYNPHDIDGGLSIKAVFGRQDVGVNRHGKTGILLTGVHFLGRGQRIEISPDVCVERYTFFARNELSLRSGRRIAATEQVNGETRYTLVGNK